MQHSLVVYTHLKSTLGTGDDYQFADAKCLPTLHPAAVSTCGATCINGIQVEDPLEFNRRRGNAGLTLPCRYRARAYIERQASIGTKGILPDAQGAGHFQTLRFATFGVGHLRLWTLNSSRGRSAVVPSYKSLGLTRGAHGASRGGREAPEISACVFLESGDLLAARTDGRLLVYRGIAPLRSIALTDCSSRIVLLQPLQRSLLLLVAQEGLVQLVPMSSFLGDKGVERVYSSRKSLRQDPQDLPVLSASLSHRHLRSACSACTLGSGEHFASGRHHETRSAGVAHLLSRSSPRPSSAGNIAVSGGGCATPKRSRFAIPRSSSKNSLRGSRGRSRSPAPFLTGSLDAPTRTPRSTYSDDIGRRAASNFGYRGRRSSTPVVLKPPRSCREASRTVLPGRRSLSASARKDLNSYTGHRQIPSRCSHEKFVPLQQCIAAATQAVQPKRTLILQDVSLQHCQAWAGTSQGEPWLPLQSSEVVGLHWVEPQLIVCTRTQLLAVNVSFPCAEAVHVIQERPLGSVDVASCLTPPEYLAHSKTYMTRNENSELLRERKPCIVAAGGKCCTGGELRLWQVGESRQKSTTRSLRIKLVALRTSYEIRHLQMLECESITPCNVGRYGEPCLINGWKVASGSSSIMT